MSIAAGKIGAVSLLLVAVLILVFLTRQTFWFSAAALQADRRPALLNDARWDDPSSALEFSNRFPLGTDASELEVWLIANEFRINPEDGRATRIITSLPCNEEIEVEWISDANRHLLRADVTIREAGCL